jgi:hypothetical protein
VRDWRQCRSGSLACAVEEYLLPFQLVRQSIMHEYTVEFRISGAELVPTSIMQELKLEPCLVREVGERRGEGKVWHKALWSYSGFPSGALKYWAPLEDGLNFILEKYDIVWWCGHFQSSFDGGPTLSARLMQRLADFGLDLYIDNYFVDSDPT